MQQKYFSIINWKYIVIFNKSHIGLAIRSNEFEAWKRSPNCIPAPNNCMYCPLCLASVEDSDEAWLAHLTSGCPRNNRTNGSNGNS